MLRVVIALVSSLVSVLAAGAPAAAAEPIVNVAHRGASAYAPENTVAAFRLAREQGADMFELDVQETRDHELVLMHDTTLSRTTDVERVFPGRAPWQVGDFTLAEVRQLSAEGEAVPTLGEALRAMESGSLRLLLEVKAPHLYPGIEARVAGELERNPGWLTRVVVQSFSWKSMRTFHRVLPQVKVGLLGTPATSDLAGLARFAGQINPPHGALTAGYVSLVHRQGMEVYTWTVDDTRTMRHLISLGVDGIITNRPDVLRAVTRDP